MEQAKYEETTKKVGNSTFVLVPRDVKKNLGLQDKGDKVEITMKKVGEKKVTYCVANNNGDLVAHDIKSKAKVWSSPICRT